MHMNFIYFLKSAIFFNEFCKLYLLNIVVCQNIIKIIYKLCRDTTERWSMDQHNRQMEDQQDRQESQDAVWEDPNSDGLMTFGRLGGRIGCKRQKTVLNEKIWKRPTSRSGWWQAHGMESMYIFSMIQVGFWCNKRTARVQSNLYMYILSLNK